MSLISKESPLHHKKQALPPSTFEIFHSWHRLSNYTNMPSFPFLKLPRELRDEFYSHLLSEAEDVYVDRSPPCNFVSHQNWTVSYISDILTVPWGPLPIF